MKLSTEQSVTLWFLSALVSLAVPFVFGGGYPLATRLAGSGGLLAVVGVAAIARPILQVGIFEWISLRAFQDLRHIMGDEAQKRYARLEDPDQMHLDEAFEKVFGPMFVGVGTALNGLSGFFS